MALDLDQRRLLYKIAKAYYEDGLTQQEIGQHLGLSRIKVSRLLRQARDEEIIQITILPPANLNAELERDVERRYGLQEAIVVSPSRYDKTSVARELGAAAAEYLTRCLRGDEVLAMSWGSTLLSVVDALPRRSWPRMRIVQMTGGLGRPETETHGADLARRMAEAFSAKPLLIPAPGVVASQLVRDALLADSQISDTLALGERADVAVVGIGVPTLDSVVAQAGILPREDAEQLKALNAVGDIALRFFDGDGHRVQHEIDDRIIGLDLDQIKGIPRVIGVAGGKDKFEVIRAALRGSIIDVLVTDDQVATALLHTHVTTG